jgi:deoxyribodipyrimidine photo-lyase
MQKPRAVWWIKRDCRLMDNACLTEAARLGCDVIPFFCFEPSLMSASDTSEMHIQAQWQAVTALRANLSKFGVNLVIAHGEVVPKLGKLKAILSFQYVFSHEETGNDITYRRDGAVAAWCRDQGILYQEFPQSSVRRGGVNRDRLQKQWQMRIVAHPPLPTPPISQNSSIRDLAAATTFPNHPAMNPNPNWQTVTEAEAQATLTDFLTRRGRWYRGGISSPNTAMTAGSRLSVHLAWGTLTTKQIWHAVKNRLEQLDPKDPTTTRWRNSLQAFLSRLHWRDHFTQRLESEPELEFRSIHPCYRDVPYENADLLFTAWKDGRTGYPMVDAVMRCLASTGFVNFRMRAMVVSFACHALHLDWRMIHPHLAGVFRDYDPGIHLNQLQMQAGVVGWNAIRVYNPTKQLKDWDPDCRFVKQWIPEFQDQSPEHILNGEYPRTYPQPVVSFAERTREMTETLYAIRRTAAAISITPGVYAKHGSRKKETNFRRLRSPRNTPTRPTLFDGF